MKAKVISTDEIIDVEKREERVGKIIYVYYYAQSGESFQDYELEFLPDPREEVTIEGWVALDEFDYGDAFIHTEKPTLNSCAIADAGDYYGCWENPGKVYTIDRSLFPDLTYENSPKKVKITITLIN